MPEQEETRALEMLYDQPALEEPQPPPPGARPHRLSAGDRLFEARGEVSLRCGKRVVTIPIRAVSMETVEEICKPYRPTQRTSAPMRNGKRMAIDPTTDHVYQQRINEFNRLSSWVYTLVAIDLDIEDDD